MGPPPQEPRRSGRTRTAPVTLIQESAFINGSSTDAETAAANDLARAALFNKSPVASNPAPAEPPAEDAAPMVVDSSGASPAAPEPPPDTDTAEGAQEAAPPDTLPAGEMMDLALASDAALQGADEATAVADTQGDDAGASAPADGSAQARVQAAEALLGAIKASKADPPAAELQASAAEAAQALLLEQQQMAAQAAQPLADLNDTHTAASLLVEQRLAQGNNSIAVTARRTVVARQVPPKPLPAAGASTSRLRSPSGSDAADSDSGEDFNPPSDEGSGEESEVDSDEDAPLAARLTSRPSVANRATTDRVGDIQRAIQKSRKGKKGRGKTKKGHLPAGHSLKPSPPEVEAVVKEPQLAEPLKWKVKNDAFCKGRGYKTLDDVHGVLVRLHLKYGKSNPDMRMGLAPGRGMNMHQYTEAFHVLLNCPDLGPTDLRSLLLWREGLNHLKQADVARRYVIPKLYPTISAAVAENLDSESVIVKKVTSWLSGVGGGKDYDKRPSKLWLLLNKPDPLPLA